MRANGGFPKVRVMSFVDKMQLQTDGTTTPSYIDINIDEALTWGPWLETIVA